jgi:hypothetical protein
MEKYNTHRLPVITPISAEDDSIDEVSIKNTCMYNITQMQHKCTPHTHTSHTQAYYMSVITVQDIGNALKWISSVRVCVCLCVWGVRVCTAVTW